jgi:hypothetical protein
MTTYVHRPDHPQADEFGMVDKALTYGEPKPNSHYVISDYLPDLRHPATGQLMDSKSNFRAVTRAKGCVEVGNEVQRDRRTIDLGDRKRDIANAIQQLGG